MVRIISQDQVVQSGNYCIISTRVLSIDEIKKKNSQQKMTMTVIQTIRGNRIALRAGKTRGAFC